MNHSGKVAPADFRGEDTARSSAKSPQGQSDRGRKQPMSGRRQQPLHCRMDIQASLFRGSSSDSPSIAGRISLQDKMALLHKWCQGRTLCKRYTSLKRTTATTRSTAIRRRKAAADAAISIVFPQASSGVEDFQESQQRHESIFNLSEDR